MGFIQEGETVPFCQGTAPPSPEQFWSYWEAGALSPGVLVKSNQKHSAGGQGNMCIYNYLNGILLQIVESMDIKLQWGKLYIIK